MIKTFKDLTPELKRTAERGYGIAISEAEPGVTAVAAAVLSGGIGSPVGTVSVAGPGVRMNEIRVADLAPLVMRAARELSDVWPLR